MLLTGSLNEYIKIFCVPITLTWDWRYRLRSTFHYDTPARSTLVRQWRRPGRLTWHICTNTDRPVFGLSRAVTARGIFGERREPGLALSSFGFRSAHIVEHKGRYVVLSGSSASARPLPAFQPTGRSPSHIRQPAVRCMVASGNHRLREKSGLVNHPVLARRSSISRSALPRLFWVLAHCSGTRSRVRSSSASR
jgi:hypothetical protein